MVGEQLGLSQGQILKLRVGGGVKLGKRVLSFFVWENPVRVLKGGG